MKSVCCGVTSGVLRQLYASKIAEYDKEYMQKQEEAANVLGHSMTVHINYIKKINDIRRKQWQSKK